jgi:hypothetical protein
MMADTETPNNLPIGLEQLEQGSQAGWNGFTRFLVVTVISLVVVLLLIAAFTVWS